MQKLQPYKKRIVSFVKQASFDDWRMKVYQISANSDPIATPLISKAITELLPRLPKIALNEHRYGVGFLIIHQGTMRNWFLIDWWENEDIMHHLLFSSPLEDSSNITAETDKSLIACVHELLVINFESEAWVNTMLSDDKPSDLNAYLGLQFSQH